MNSVGLLNRVLGFLILKETGLDFFCCDSTYFFDFLLLTGGEGDECRLRLTGGGEASSSLSLLLDESRGFL